MKDSFYTLLVAIFLIVIYFVWKHPITDDVSDFNNGIVIDKNADYFIGDIMHIKMPNDSIVKIRCYDILFEKYRVGDTIQ